MKEHELDIDSFARALRKAYPRTESLDQAIRDAAHIASELDKLQHPPSEVEP